MAVTISVNNQQAKRGDENRPHLTFEDGDAAYWHLHKGLLISITAATNKIISLYDNTEFDSEDLPKLEKLLQNELLILKNHPVKQWEVHTGTTIFPTKKEIFKPLTKKDLQATLTQFLNIIQSAKKQQKTVLCEGD